MGWWLDTELSWREGVGERALVLVLLDCGFAIVEAAHGGFVESLGTSVSSGPVTRMRGGGSPEPSFVVEWLDGSHEREGYGKWPMRSGAMVRHAAIS